MAGEIRVLDDAAAVEAAAAEVFINSAAEAVAERTVFTVALAGGSSPRSLYTRLAAEPLRSRVDWSKVEFFWGDERHVPPDHPDSNYRMARESLLSPLRIPARHVHRVRAENDAAAAAAAYERELIEFFRPRRLTAGRLPRFDLVLLGLGPDAHCASLFPGTDAIEETTALVAAPWVEKFNSFRVTVTPPVLNAARRVVFVATGEAKAEALRAVLGGEHDPARWPAQIVRPSDGELLWLVDRAAASRLP